MTIPKCPMCGNLHTGECPQRPGAVFTGGGISGSDFPRFYDRQEPDAPPIEKGCFHPVRDHSIFCNNCQREFPAGVGHDCHVSRAEFDALRADVQALGVALKLSLSVESWTGVCANLPAMVRLGGGLAAEVERRRIAEGK